MTNALLAARLIEHAELIERRGDDYDPDLLRAAAAALTPKARASATVTPPTFSTGDAALDAFMRRTWRPEHATAAAKRRTAGLVNAAPLKPRKWSRDDIGMLARFNDLAVKFWRERGYTVTIEGGAIDGNGTNVRVLAPEASA